MKNTCQFCGCKGVVGYLMYPQIMDMGFATFAAWNMFQFCSHCAPYIVIGDAAALAERAIVLGYFRTGRRSSAQLRAALTTFFNDVIGAEVAEA